jgi:hypothetical protein
MTREEKVKKRQERAFKRKGKRIAKDKSYLNTSEFHSYGPNRGISWGRRKQNGRVFQCDMGYSDCELRMYCNLDC